ncbi:Mor transcription activator family protein [Enterococcus rivorum]|uniref:Mor transcription activator domain-containing protein n=1 Tax=Enterococcus rivorum TaxID=762845 RepID=A0A1E5KUA3_9ENTE|nr:Mor transcription activator family protein [Enterococcus rivorum]MBP2098929.1 hypothetical protein [Enterococcus rivorum]OEH81472.1 hypothetical protein BCR26_04295 [Enterococcus rivorum]
MAIDTDCLASSYQSVLDFFKEEEISPEVLSTFHYIFKGQQISYPMKLYDKHLVAEKIREKFDQGKEVDIREFTTTYGFSTRWVQGVIKEMMKESVSE